MGVTALGPPLEPSLSTPYQVSISSFKTSLERQGVSQMHVVLRAQHSEGPKSHC